MRPDLLASTATVWGWALVAKRGRAEPSGSTERR